MGDKGSEFYNRSMKSRLEKKSIEMYSIHNEGKSVVAERLTNTIISKNLYIDTVTKYNSTHYRTIKMKPVDVKPRIYIDFNEEIIIKVLNWNLAIMLE